METRGPIVRVGAKPERAPMPPLVERVKTRILRMVVSGRRSWQYAPEPGYLHWHQARAGIGTNADRATFDQALDELLAEGKLVEVWLEPVAWRQGMHLLLLPDYAGVLPHPVVEARCRRDALARSPAAALRMGDNVNLHAPEDSCLFPLFPCSSPVFTHPDPVVALTVAFHSETELLLQRPPRSRSRCGLR